MRTRVSLLFSLTVFATLSGPTAPAQTLDRAPGELAWVLRSEPKFDPAKVDEQASETVRFLTGGVLLRVNRPTQQPEPELAEAWSVSPDGKLVTFKLRSGLRFSDGSPLTSRDVVATLKRVLDPATQAPTADEFLAPKQVTVDAPDPLTVRVHLPQRIIGVGNIFDEIAIEPAGHPSETRVTAGPFVLADYRQGQYVRLKRNPNYFRRDARGAQLPYASGIRLDILSNREQEVTRFERGAYDLIDSLPPEYFGLLQQRDAKAVRDLGPSLNIEQMWFNEAAQAPLPDYEKAWFQNQFFRVAISQAINRGDLARIAYGGHATPAHDFISPANTMWHNAHLRTLPDDSAAAARTLAAHGFHKQGSRLVDAGGHAVKFSILTNAGNRARAQMATLIQQDLAALGIEVNVVTLDFPALIERLMHKQDYEACLLGLTNVDPDPNSMMNVWQSSSPNHQWNPSEKKPATAWEAQIDRDMQQQATALKAADRKRAVDEVQQIVADQQPFIYLVYPNTLVAVSPQLQGVQPTIFHPSLIWNIASVRRAGGR